MVRKWHKFFLIVFVITLGVGCDQTTKRVAEQTLKGAPMRSMLNDTVRLQYVQNTGAFLGFGSHFSRHVKFWTFTALPILTLLGILLFAFFSRRLNKIQIILLMLIVSGGIGNLLDRVFLDGKVTDFLNMGIGPIRTGIFNIADVAIMFGTFGLIGYSILSEDDDLECCADALPVEPPAAAPPPSNEPSQLDLFAEPPTAGVPSSRPVSRPVNELTVPPEE